MSKVLPTNGFKWIEPKESDSNKYSSKSSKGWVLEFDFEYLQELRMWIAKWLSFSTRYNRNQKRNVP